MTANTFSVVDYLVFGAMLLVSSVIGIYHAYGGKQSSTKEYLMAGKGMHVFPIFVSLLASYLSAITLLGVPSEIYTYGVQYCVLIISYFILCTTAAVIYAPIFYKLNIVSANEVSLQGFLYLFNYCAYKLVNLNILSYFSLWSVHFLFLLLLFQRYQNGNTGQGRALTAETKTKTHSTNPCLASHT